MALPALKLTELVNCRVVHLRLRTVFPRTLLVVVRHATRTTFGATTLGGFVPVGPVGPVVPAGGLPVGAGLPGGGGTNGVPVPVTITEIGVNSLSDRLIVAVRSPVVVGAKRTPIAHVWSSAEWPITALVRV